ncbi:Probable phospholipid-binding lipoprotein mlaA precursor [Serratia fonticola]|uniref:Probable phospholipid-binding lipoprotein mlaA n=1 Tax=Serratia fonticola TaxID=47917 RepID=A0A4U9VNV5_SERFO|nr:Probable phospholipid-binding lipoprotein mlaA precursor [Serratia fonticola]
MGGLIDVAGMANPKLAREEPRRFGGTLGNYGVGYGRMSTYRSTAASPFVKTVATGRIAFIRC